MPHGKTSRIFLIAFRIVCVLVWLVLVTRIFQSEGWRGVLGSVAMVITTMCLVYAGRQGEKLAADNMRKVGLNPDRDEAHRA